MVRSTGNPNPKKRSDAVTVPKRRRDQAEVEAGPALGKSGGGRATSENKTGAGKRKKLRRLRDLGSENDEEDEEVEAPWGEVGDEDAEEEEEVEGNCGGLEEVKPKRVIKKAVTANEDGDEELEVIDPIPRDEALRTWPTRYGTQEQRRSITAEGELDGVLQAKEHYRRAKIDGVIYGLGDHAYVQGEVDKPYYIARILEIFQPIVGEPHFVAQWFYRAEDTIIQDAVKMDEEKRVFISDDLNDNPLNCLVSKIKLVYVEPNIDLNAKRRQLPDCDLFYDMKYSIPFRTFANTGPGLSSADNAEDMKSESCSTISSEGGSPENVTCKPSSSESNGKDSELHLLDLYAGCGGMSTGLCMGAAKAGVNLVTKWAVDMNPYACETLAKNHPETKVRKMAASDFLLMLKAWEGLCTKFNLFGPEDSCSKNPKVEDDNEEEDSEDDSEPLDEAVFEVEEFLDFCYGDPNKINQRGIYFKVAKDKFSVFTVGENPTLEVASGLGLFISLDDSPTHYLKVRWKGYGPEEDTWEPVDGLGECELKLKEFVTKGFQSNILPLPGTVDVICGGPPCQGISGFNRFRNKKDPLEDEKNKQLLVFMDIVDYLKPKYVLMENVVDILKFSGGKYGRYAIGRLVQLNYQARLGIMAAGKYGVPQFRFRVFLWGCQPSKCLPQYPLPTHDAANRGVLPNDFKECHVTSEDEKMPLHKAVFLEDAIGDLPAVATGDLKDECSYGTEPKTDFQTHIRIRRSEMVGFADRGDSDAPMLYDHIPLNLSKDDLQRARRIPKRKGACFRDLPGVLVNEITKKVYIDTSIEREMLESGKPLVPDYAITFVKGTSTKPFARLWWDETVPTVVTRAEPHNQKILHPEQDRVLTIRENARLQGFPDCYRLYGPIKQRYIQIGNAVAVPVAFALGYCFGEACESSVLESPVTTLPCHFPSCLLQPTEENSADQCE